MKLSEAIMLGSTTCKMERANWNTCAIGCAGTAVGIEVSASLRSSLLRARRILQEWPWLNCLSEREYCYSEEIWTRFDNEVVPGYMTLEQLVDYVKSVEPDCGECKQFSCSCKKTEVEVERSEKVLG